MTTRWIVVAVTVALAAGCGQESQGPAVSSVNDSTPSGLSAECTQAALAYGAARWDARVCDPGAASVCIEGLPTLVYEQFPNGDVILQGMCTSGQSAVDQAKVSTLKQLLLNYESLGCYRMVCPSGPPRTSPPQCVPTTTGQGECR